MNNLLFLLNQRIKYIHTDHWGKRGAPEVLLCDDIQENVEAEGLSGTVEIRVPKRNGELTLYQSYKLEGINTPDKIDDFLSEILSQVLAEHMNWPR